MEYRVVYARGQFAYMAKQNLERDVKELCQKGWKPQGGVSISCWDDGDTQYTYMVQAMVKEN